jgi:hypothetical protein
MTNMSPSLTGTLSAGDYRELKLQLDNHLKPGQGLHRNVLFYALCVPKT